MKEPPRGLWEHPPQTGLSLWLRDLFPAANQFADLHDHDGNMLILAGCQPFPSNSQAAVESDIIQVFIRDIKILEAIDALPVV